jgi:RNA-directed DNA polymerase
MPNNTGKNWYKKTRIKKKGGGFRVLEIPQPWLRDRQRAILRTILYKLAPHAAAYGFVRGRSPYDNAKRHVRAKVLVNLDLENFFPSITRDMVARAIRRKVLTEGEVKTVLRFCLYRGQLPQGAPTSPALSNLVCLRFDARLEGLARSRGAHYTRYADDITFSSIKTRDLHNIIPLVKKIAEEEGFAINEKKTRVMRYTGRMVVTGLVVNKKVNLPRERARLIRAMFHQANEKSNLKTLSGYAGYVHQVRKGAAQKYRRVLKTLSR